MSFLEQIKIDLRVKYLQDRDELQRQVDADPELWSEENLLDTAEKVGRGGVKSCDLLHVLLQCQK